MTEREKCQLGLLYDTTFPGRDEDNLRCLDLCHEFNQMKPSDLAGREAILRKILHRVGKNVRAEQNIYISFGYNIEAGDNLFINHNCVFLDPGKITFGDNVFIGPCCGFYTAHHPIDTDLFPKENICFDNGEMQLTINVHTGPVERLWNTQGVPVKATVSLPVWNTKCEIELGAYQFCTYCIDKKRNMEPTSIF